MITKRLSLAGVADFGWIITMTLAASLLMYSGWRDQSPFDSPDIRAHQGNAIDLRRHSVIPYRGQGLSYSGWGPPGTSYLMVPGVLLMADPRLAEIPGAVLLHFGTLLFLFLIVRGWISRGAAPENDYRVVEFLGADRDIHPVGCPWDGYDLVWESREYAICARRP